MINLLKAHKAIIIWALIASMICFSSTFFYINNIHTQRVDMHGDVAVVFSNVDELQAQSELITEVQIMETKSFFYNDNPFTLSKAKVKKVYKGNTTNEYINILEHGGKISNRDFVFEENPVLSRGDKAITFLKKYNGPVAKDAYFIRGSYQGKFTMSDNDAVIPPKNASNGIGNIRSIKDLKIK